MSRVVVSIDRISKEYQIIEADTSIGRDNSSHIIIGKPYVSRTHFRIENSNGKFFIRHAAKDAPITGNGFWYEGYKYTGNETFTQQLMHGDIFYIGSPYGDLVTITYYDDRPESLTAFPTPSALSTLLNQKEITIGGGTGYTISLQHPRVKGHIASLKQEPDGKAYRLINHGTKRVNINSQAIYTSHLLTPSDQISIGPFKFLYTNEKLIPYPKDNGIHLEVQGLKQVIEKKKFIFFKKEETVLLNDISLTISPGTFVALLGGSGTGKSTLIKALSGYQRPTDGTVLYNGLDYYDNQGRSRYCTQLGYVPQEDILHFDLTVQAALSYAAQMRLPSDFTEKQIEQRIENVLLDVGMTAHEKKLVKELSGGQRKRISIAIELLSNPSIFFLDEPISGLDPGLDLEIMLLLRNLAKRGQTIIISTHSINHIGYCDRICFLMPGGDNGARLAYFGPPGELKPFFNTVISKGEPEISDLTQIYRYLELKEQKSPDNETIKVKKDKHAEKIAEKFKASANYKNYVELPKNPKSNQSKSSVHNTDKQKPFKRKPFVLLCKRYAELLKNDKVNLWILRLQAPIIAIILLLLNFAQYSLHSSDAFNAPVLPKYQGDAQRFLFIMAFAAVMFGCINAAREIVKEIHIYQREHMVGLGIVPYLSSKIVVLGRLCLLQSFILALIIAITFLFSGNNLFLSGIFLPVIFEAFITLALTSLAGLTLGLLVSALVTTNELAMTVIPLILIPQVIFSGIIFPLQNVFSQSIGALFAVRWAMAALGSSFSLDNALFASNGNGGDKLFGTCDTCGTFRHETGHLLLAWGVLIAMIILLTVATGYFLKRKEAQTLRR